MKLQCLSRIREPEIKASEREKNILSMEKGLGSLNQRLQLGTKAVSGRLSEVMTRLSYWTTYIGLEFGDYVQMYLLA
jgi:hypothetical protein